MQTLQYTTVDKSSWPRGEWDSEPDKKQWVDPETGLPCLIVRACTSGALCGYVGVPLAHPLYGKEYGDAPVSVHGSLTFSDKCRPSTQEGHGICHKVEAGEDDNVWWLGFDCAHYTDEQPNRHAMLASLNALSSILGEPNSVLGPRAYRNLAYVTAEVESLARQLKALA